MAAVPLDLSDLPDLGDGPPPETPPAPAPSSMKQTIIATAIVTVIAAAMGALFAIPPTPTPAAAPAQKDDATPGGAVPAGAGLFDMPPVVTNLGAPQDTWIRLEASIVYDVKALPHPESMAAEIAGDELAYLRTVTLPQLEGPVGLQDIRQDLNERAVLRSGGKVTELIIRTLVVQ